MRDHFMISESDGNLYDTRIEGWADKPIRTNYSYTHSKIESVSDLKAVLRAGPYAWPGGYPLYFITNDGSALSFESVRENLVSIFDSIKSETNDGWRIVSCQINYEDSDLVCDHSGLPIDSAYGESE